MHPKASGIRLYFICASAMAPLAVAMSVIASPPKIDDPTWSGKEGSPVRSRTAPLLTGSPQHLRSVVAGTSPTAKPDPAMPADFGEVVRETLRKAQYEIVALESDASAATPADCQARNPLHQLRASFSTDGVTLRSLSEAQGAWEFGLSLAAVGYEGELRAVTSPTIVVKDNGVDYLRDGLVEWYVNDDRGLEQGFTIHSAPPGTRNRTPSGSAGAIAPETLEVRLDLTGNLAAKLVDGGSAVLLRDGSGTGVLRVKDLFAFDATGRVLPAEFALDGSQFALLIDVHGAVYPVTIDPLIVTEQAKLTAADAAAGDDWFGHSVAISGDTALVGAPNDDGPAGTEQGSAYVFVRSGTVWNLRAKLTASDAAPYDYFGYSVALSGDTALVGAFPEDGPAGEAQGSAYVFTRSGTVWSQQAKLTASDAAAFDYFGFSVALSGDTALVGTPFDDALLPFWDYGAAYVFVRSGTVWSQQAKLTAGDATRDDFFGGSVALSSDTALVGARLDDGPGGVDQGSTYVFVRNGTVWSPQGKLTASDAAAIDYFGDSVAVSGDTALVAAPSDDGPAGVNQGSVYVFARSGTVWSQQAKLTAADAAAGDSFGSSIGLSGDTALVGAAGDNGPAGAYQGSAYMFVRGANNVWDNGSLDQRAKLTASDAAANDFFGAAVAFSGDTALMGALFDDGPAGLDQGSAYVFTLTFVECLTPADCPDDGNVCTTATCTDNVCGVTHNTLPCDDEDACTQTDTCEGGSCVGSNPVVCTALDQCHDAGICDPATGLCSDPPSLDGTVCDDEDSCTQTDTCQGGSCVGSNPVVCTALDQCHDAGICDPATGLCSDPPSLDGTACDDGDACTTDDTCSAGACVGGPPLDCDDDNICTDDGCDPDTGCVQVDNTARCDDGQFCNGVETCAPAGDCIAGDPPCAVEFLCDEALDTCAEAIPTVSQWGLVILTLLLLSGAKIFFGRRPFAGLGH